MKLRVVFKALLLATLVLAILGEEGQTTKGSPVTFNADVAKMLDILVNSLYTKRSIFLREIISNGSDALDRIRFFYLTEPKEPVNAEGVAPTMDIRIRLDREERKLIMTDGGIGMTPEELSSNLGSLGSSGTKKFLEAMKEGTDANFIGQFGVGFYSVFLVSDKVQVASKNDASETQWVWESTGDGTYYLYPDPRGNTLGRGTELVLFLKQDAEEYLDEEKVKETVHHYSEFIHFPIYILSNKPSKDPKSNSEEGEAEEDATALSTTGTTNWELINQNKPIWTRKLDEVEPSEYEKFYKSITKDYASPLFYSHFATEGEMEFKSLLFIPSRVEDAQSEKNIRTNIKLYVRRVFITDEFSDMLPRYLEFVKGVVDSDDLPLNVGREVLQESRVLKTIKKKLIRKVLGMLADIAENDKLLAENPNPPAKPGQKQLTSPTYEEVWHLYGKYIRLGIIEDGINRVRLMKLLRYKSTSSDKLISLDDYVERAPESQKEIYYLAGEAVASLKNSPLLEDALEKGVEVLLMEDAIDEYVMTHVTDYAGKKFVNLAKDSNVLADNSKEGKARAAKRAEKYNPLIKWFISLLGNKVTRVVLTRRVTQEAIIVSSPEHGISANMWRIQRGQTLGDKQATAALRLIAELNPAHPLVNEIHNRIAVDKDDAVAGELGLTLFDLARLRADVDLEDTKEFNIRVGRLLRQSVDIAPDAGLIEEDMSQYDGEVPDDVAARIDEEAAAETAELTEGEL